jgi:hypothetical protein
MLIEKKNRWQKQEVTGKKTPQEESGILSCGILSME